MNGESDSPAPPAGTEGTGAQPADPAAAPEAASITTESSPAVAAAVPPPARRTLLARLRSFEDPEGLLRGLALGTMIGAGVGLGLWLWLALDDQQLRAFVDRNVLDGAARRQELGLMALCGLAFAGLSLLVALRGRRGLADGVWAFTARLSPLGLLPFVPLLSSWEAWANHTLSFLVLVALFGLLAERSWRLASASPPIFAGPRAGSRALGAWLDAMTRPLAVDESARAETPPFSRAALGVVVLMALGFAIYFSVITVQSHLNLRTQSFDLGLEMNLLWNIVNGGKHFKSAPLGGPDAIHFGYHATVFSYLLAPLYALFERGETLLVVQASLLGAAAIPLYLWARHHIGNGPALVVAAVYLLYPPLHGSILYDFHYPPLAPFFIWWAWYFLERRRDLWAAVFVLVALSIREDVAAGLVVMGLHVALFGGRAVAGTIVAVVSTVYFSTMKFVVMPSFRSDEQAFVYMFKDLLPEGETGYGGVVKTVATNPGYALGTLLLGSKLEYVLRLFTPLLFLPLRRAGGLLLILPGAMFTLLSTGYDPLIQTSFQYTTHWTLYLFPGLVLGLAALSRPRTSGDTAGPARFQAALVALVLVALASSYQHGAILQHNTARGGFYRFTFGTSAQDLSRRESLAKVLEQLPADVNVAASEFLVPQVANRANAYSLRHGVFDADHILCEPRALTKREKRRLPRILQRGDWGVIAEDGPFVLLKRGAPAGSLSRHFGKLVEPAEPDEPEAPR